MNPQQTELARRLVAHERWEWRVGMMAIGTSGGLDSSIRLFWPVTLHKGERGPIGVHNGGNRWPISMHGPYIPDLTDDATAGVLLGMWREAEGMSDTSAVGVLSAMSLCSDSETTHMAELVALMLLDAWGAK